MFMDISKIGSRIKELKELKNLKQDDLIELTGLSRVTISNYEQGKVKPPVEFLMKLAETYDVSIDWLCGLNSKHTNKINSIYDVAKTVIDLSQVKGISLVIRKKTETTTVVYHGFDYPEIEEEPYTSFSFSLTDVPELYNKLKSGNCDHDTVKLYEDSILNQFFDKLLTYINLYREEKIDIDDYRTLCEKALNSVKILEKNQRIFEELNFEDFDKDDDNENDLPF